MTLLKIRSLCLSNQLILAPMLKVTDLPFRILCREQGASLAFAEMTHTEAILRNPKVLERVSRSTPQDKPFGIQLASQSPEQLGRAILLLESAADVFDLNLGCPSPKTVRHGFGAALLQKPQTVFKLVQAMRNATQKPIMIKMRLPNNPQKAFELAQVIESAGADALTVHGRTLTQKRSGKPNFAIVAKIKENLSIPVIQNSGIWDSESLAVAAAATKADGFMIARPALGNPGIFAQLLGKPGISKTDGLRRYLGLCRETGFSEFGRIKTNSLQFLSGQSKTVSQSFQQAKKIERLAELAQDLPENSF